jgi:hypothetical protein
MDTPVKVHFHTFANAFLALYFISQQVGGQLSSSLDNVDKQQVVKWLSHLVIQYECRKCFFEQVLYQL